jgi:hypothetical protein
MSWPGLDAPTSLSRATVTLSDSLVLLPDSTSLSHESYSKSLSSCRPCADLAPADSAWTVPISRISARRARPKPRTCRRRLCQVQQFWSHPACTLRLTPRYVNSVESSNLVAEGGPHSQRGPALARPPHAGGRLHCRKGNPAQHTAACSAIPNIVFTHDGFFSTSDSIALLNDSTHGYTSSSPHTLARFELKTNVL